MRKLLLVHKALPLRSGQELKACDRKDKLHVRARLKRERSAWFTFYITFEFVAISKLSVKSRGKTLACACDNKIALERLLKILEFSQHIRTT